MHKKMVIKHDGGIPALSAYSDNSASEPEYFVDRIMDAYIGEGGKWKYLVRWQGYSEIFDSWEPEENLSALKKELKEAREYVRQASGLSPEAKSASSPATLNPAHNLISGRRSSTETAYSPVDGKRRLQEVEERGAGIESAERCDEKDESSISEEGSEEDETSSVVRPTRLERSAAKPERKARAPSPSAGEDSGTEEDGSLASEESDEDDRNLSLRFKRREPSAGRAETRMAGAVGKAAPSSTNACASSGGPKHVSNGPPARSDAKRRRQESASKSSDSSCPAAQESRAKRSGLAHSEHTPPSISAPQPIGLQPLGKAHRRPVGMLNNVLAGRSCGDAGVRSKLPAETAPSRHAQESAHPPSPPICKPANPIAGLDVTDRINVVRGLYLRRSRMEVREEIINKYALTTCIMRVYFHKSRMCAVYVSAISTSHSIRHGQRPTQFEQMESVLHPGIAKLPEPDARWASWLPREGQVPGWVFGQGGGWREYSLDISVVEFQFFEGTNQNGLHVSVQRAIDRRGADDKCLRDTSKRSPVV